MNDNVTFMLNNFSGGKISRGRGVNNLSSTIVDKAIFNNLFNSSQNLNIITVKKRKKDKYNENIEEEIEEIEEKKEILDVTNNVENKRDHLLVFTGDEIDFSKLIKTNHPDIQLNLDPVDIIIITYRPFYDIETFFPGFFPGIADNMRKRNFEELFYIIKNGDEKRPKKTDEIQNYILTYKWEPNIDSSLEDFYFRFKDLKEVVKLCQYNIGKYVNRVEEKYYNNFIINKDDIPLIQL